MKILLVIIFSIIIGCRWSYATSTYVRSTNIDLHSGTNLNIDTITYSPSISFNYIDVASSQSIPINTMGIINNYPPSASTLAYKYYQSCYTPYNIYISTLTYYLSSTGITRAASSFFIYDYNNTQSYSKSTVFSVSDSTYAVVINPNYIVTAGSFTICINQYPGQLGGTNGGIFSVS